MTDYGFMVWQNLTKLVEETVKGVQGLFKRKTNNTPGQVTDAAERHRQKRLAKAQAEAKAYNQVETAIGSSGLNAVQKRTRAARTASTSKAGAKAAVKGALNKLRQSAQPPNVMRRVGGRSAFPAVKKALDKATGKAPKEDPPTTQVALRF